MRIDIITVLPQLLKGPLDESILKRGMQKGVLDIRVHDLRPYGLGKHQQVDDEPYGGSAGMVLMIEPIAACIRELQKKCTYDEIIYMTPDGKRFDQQTANRLSLKQNLLILCGHYKGIDERIREKFITMEISIGDYVLTGGELAAAVVTDAICRLVPGVLNDESSALSDSFQDQLLAPPVYTRPAEFEGSVVPEILRSGNFAAIENWEHEEALRRTRERRPDLLGEE